MKKITLIMIMALVTLTACSKKDKEVEPTTSTEVIESTVKTEGSTEEMTETSYHPTLPLDAPTIGGDIVEIEIPEYQEEEIYHKYKWSDEALAIEEYPYWEIDEGPTGFEEGVDNGSNWANNAAIMKYISMPTEPEGAGPDMLTDFLRANGIKDIFVICDMNTMEESDLHYRWDSSYSGGVITTYYNKESKNFSFKLK